MILIINNKTYEVDKKVALNCIKTAKESCGMNTIVALQKGDVIEMVKQRYSDRRTLLKAIQEYNKSGILVYEKGGL
jgi:hypothetical protein